MIELECPYCATTSRMSMAELAAEPCVQTCDACGVSVEFAATVAVRELALAA